MIDALIASITILSCIALVAGVMMLVFEIGYRWRIHYRGWHPSNSKRESFLKYLFMAWFVRTERWYKKRENT